MTQDKAERIVDVLSRLKMLKNAKDDMKPGKEKPEDCIRHLTHKDAVDALNVHLEKEIARAESALAEM